MFLSFCKCLSKAELGLNCIVPDLPYCVCLIYVPLQLNEGKDFKSGLVCNY